MRFERFEEAIESCPNNWGPCGGSPKARMAYAHTRIRLQKRVWHTRVRAYRARSHHRDVAPPAEAEQRELITAPSPQVLHCRIKIPLDAV